MFEALGGWVEPSSMDDNSYPEGEFADAGEVWVYELRTDDRGQESRGALLRVEKPYTGSQLRAIQRVKWGDWWKARRQADA